MVKQKEKKKFPETKLKVMENSDLNNRELKFQL